MVHKEAYETGNGPGLRHHMLERIRSGLKEQLSTQSVVDRYNRLKQQRNEVRASSTNIQTQQIQVVVFFN